MIRIAINAVITAHITSEIGWAKIISFKPTKIGKIKMIGIKQIPCLKAPIINPSVPLPNASKREEYTKKYI